jgi:hypothetical protein
MCDDALDIRMQLKFKGKSRTPDILLIYFLTRNIFIKNGARVVQLVMTGLRTWWYGNRISVAIRYLFFALNFQTASGARRTYKKGMFVLFRGKAIGARCLPLISI